MKEAEAAGKKMSALFLSKAGEESSGAASEEQKRKSFLGMMRAKGKAKEETTNGGAAGKKGIGIEVASAKAAAGKSAAEKPPVSRFVMKWLLT